MSDISDCCVRMIRPLEILTWIGDVSTSKENLLIICKSEVNAPKTWKSFVGVRFEMCMTNDDKFVYRIDFDGNVDTISNGFIMANGELYLSLYNSTKVIVIRQI